MSWIGLRCAQDGVLCPSGLGQPNLGLVPQPDAMLPQGTLTIDFIHEPFDRPVNILRHARRDPEPAVLTLRSDPDGTLSLLMRHGERDALHSLPLQPLMPAEPVRMTYIWTQTGGAFAASLPDRGLTEVQTIDQPLPLSWRDATLIMADRGGCRTAPGFGHAAIADHPAPLGPLPCIDGAGIVDTPDGPRALHRVRQGDRVIAADGALATVVWTGFTDLPSPAAGGALATAHLLRAPYFGVRSDLSVSGAAVLRLTGSEVDYLFGEAEVAVSAARLADGHGVQPLTATPPQLRRWHQVALDRPVALRVSGAAIETLDTDAIRHTPGLHRWSILANLPADALPGPPSRPCLHLRDYEAQILRQMRAA